MKFRDIGAERAVNLAPGTRIEITIRSEDQTSVSGNGDHFKKLVYFAGCPNYGNSSTVRFHSVKQLQGKQDKPDKLSLYAIEQIKVLEPALANPARLEKHHFTPETMIEIMVAQNMHYIEQPKLPFLHVPEYSTMGYFIGVEHRHRSTPTLKFWPDYGLENGYSRMASDNMAHDPCKIKVADLQRVLILHVTRTIK